MRDQWGPLAGQTQRSWARTATSVLPRRLYRCYDSEGRLLYIGCSSNPKRRMSGHMNPAATSRASRLLQQYMATWEVDDDRYANREAGEQAEAAAIRDEAPLFNIQHRGRPTWLLRLDVEQYVAERKAAS